MMPRILLSIALALLVSPQARAETAQLAAARDTSIYFNLAGGNSNGLGPTFFAGNNAGNNTRRALLAFDLSSIPAGSVIESVQLRLYLAQAGSFPVEINLHRTLTMWGEGTSNAGIRGGAGAPATAGDATWLHSSYPGSLWTTPGGDFIAASSGSTVVSTEDFTYTWQSTPGTVADVQYWLDHPEQNFGWMLRGDESQSATAKAFASREYFDSALQPLLTISYTAVPEPACTAILPAALALLLVARKRRSRR